MSSRWLWCKERGREIRNKGRKFKERKEGWIN